MVLFMHELLSIQSLLKFYIILHMIYIISYIQTKNIMTMVMLPTY